MHAYFTNTKILDTPEYEKSAAFLNQQDWCWIWSGDCLPCGNEYTISTWFVAPGDATRTWRTLTRGAGADHQVLIDSNGFFGAYDNAGGHEFCASKLNINSVSKGWHHLTAVAKDGETTFFIDGEEKGYCNFQSKSGIYSIGNHNLLQKFATHLRDFKFFSRAVNSDEIPQIMKNQHAPSLDNNLELWISFTELTISDKTGKHQLHAQVPSRPVEIYGQLGYAFTSANQEVNLVQENGVPLWSPSKGHNSYSICAWFEAPLPLKSSWSTLTRGSLGDHQVLVNEKGQLGVWDNVTGTSFHPCGFNMKTLSTGWHHLVAVAVDMQTQFFIDTKLVGASDFQSKSNLTSVGNSINGTQAWGTKIKDFRVYRRVLSDVEIVKMFQKDAIEGSVRTQMYYRNLNMDSVLKFGGLSESTCKLPDQQESPYNFKEMFNNPKLSDVQFQVAGSVLYAHKVILCAQSKVFHAMFLSGMKESQQSVISIPDVDLATFSIFLQFFYTRSVDNALHSTDNNNSIDIIALLKLADQYDVPTLKNYCVAVLKDTNLADLHTQAVLDLALTALHYNLPDVLSSCAQHLISFYDKTELYLGTMDDKILVLLLRALHYYPL